MVRRIRRGDFIIEQAGEDEADAGAAGAADVGEDLLERGDGHGDEVAQDDDRGRDGGEAGIAHTVAAGWDAGFGRG